MNSDLIAAIRAECWLLWRRGERVVDDVTIADRFDGREREVLRAFRELCDSGELRPIQRPEGTSGAGHFEIVTASAPAQTDTRPSP